MGGYRAKDARATPHEKADAVATIRTRPKQHLLSIGHRAFTLIVLILYNYLAWVATLGVIISHTGLHWEYLF